MTKAPEQVTELNRAAVETAMSLAQVALENADKLVRLQLETVREMLEENLKNAKALKDAKNPEQLAELREKVMEDSVEQATAYSRRRRRQVGAGRIRAGAGRDQANACCDQRDGRYAGQDGETVCRSRRHQHQVGGGSGREGRQGWHREEARLIGKTPPPLLFRIITESSG